MKTNHNPILWVVINAQSDDPETQESCRSIFSNRYGILGEDIKKEDAYLIVKRLNSHDELVSALKDLLELNIELDITPEENPIIYNAQQALKNAEVN